MTPNENALGAASRAGGVGNIVGRRFPANNTASRAAGTVIGGGSREPACARHRQSRRRSGVPRGHQGTFATALLRAATEEGATFVSLIAFADLAERLLELGKGDAVAVSGRAKLSSWTGKDGAERHRLSIVATEIGAARPRSNSAHNAGAANRRPTALTNVCRGDRSAGARTRSDAAPLPNDPVSDLWPG
jgi:hypothetical protein